MAWVLKSLMWMGATFATVVIAWVLSNLGDDEPVPLAPVLKEAPVDLPPRDNAYYGFMGLWSPQEDYMQAGVTHAEVIDRWVLEHPPSERGPHVGEPVYNHDRRNAKVHAFANCERHKPCWSLWDDKPQVVMAAAASREKTLLPRCRQLAAMRFEEVPGAPDYDRPLPVATGISDCLKTLQAEALIAWRQAREEDALRDLELSHRMASSALQGSRTLVTHMTAVRYMSLTYEWAAHISAEVPRWGPRLAALAAPLPPGALDMRRAFRYEAALDRFGASAFKNGCLGGLANKVSFEVHLLRSVACEGAFPLAFRVQQTRNERQPGWVTLIEALDKPAPAALEWLLAQPGSPAQWWRRITWRNTGTNLVAANAPMREFAPYLARQYDMELHRLALVAAIELHDERRDIAETLQAANRAPMAGKRLWWDSSTASVAMTLWESVDTAIVTRLPSAR